MQLIDRCIVFITLIIVVLLTCFLTDFQVKLNNMERNQGIIHRKLQAHRHSLFTGKVK